MTMARAEPPSVSQTLLPAVSSALPLVQRKERSDPEEAEHLMAAEVLDSIRPVCSTWTVTFATDSVGVDEDVCKGLK